MINERNVFDRFVAKQVGSLLKNAPDWRKEYPSAADEPPSVPLEPLVLEETNEFGENWWSSQYQVVRRVYPDDPVFGSRRGMIYLGISNYDQTSRHDWRHFQEIKNQLAGPDWEAIEIYPAEDRLMDPSNLFMLFCFKVRIKAGSTGARRVLDSDQAPSPQRGFAK